MRTSISRIAMGSHGVITTDWSADERGAFQAGSPKACSVILCWCLQQLRKAKAADFPNTVTRVFGARPRVHRKSRSVRGWLALSCLRVSSFRSFALAFAASMFAWFAAKSASSRALRSSRLSGGSCGRGAAAA